jgi:hypothetical protein
MCVMTHHNFLGHYHSNIKQSQRSIRDLELITIHYTYRLVPKLHIVIYLNVSTLGVIITHTTVHILPQTNCMRQRTKLSCSEVIRHCTPVDSSRLLKLSAAGSLCTRVATLLTIREGPPELLRQPDQTIK